MWWTGSMLGGAEGVGFVYQDAVHLVDDSVVVYSLDEVGESELHVVTQVIETEFVVRPVGDVAAISVLAVGVRHIVLDRPHGEAEEAVDGAHPFRVALGQVIVDRDNVDPRSLERIQIGGGGGDQG